MTALVLAAAAVIVLGTTAAVCYLAGRERGYTIGHSDGYRACWQQDAFDVEMDAMNPDDGYAELYGDGEVTR